MSLVTEWTIAAVAFLTLFMASSVAAVIGLTPSVDFSVQILLTFFFASLAVVAWMKTPWGALLVVVLGLAFFVAELISAALYSAPQYGPQSSQYSFALGTLLIPLFGLLSYRAIQRRG